VDQAIFKSIRQDEFIVQYRTEREVMNYLMNGGAYHIFTKEEEDYQLLLKQVLSGNLALIFDGEKKAIVYDVKKFEKRSVASPDDEGVVKGAKDSFIEVMRVNTALVRRRVRSEYLVMEALSTGTVSKTDMTLCYISNIVNMDTVNQIRSKIQAIDIDNISTPAFIEEYLIENKKSLFPQIMYTERPDRISANLSDGRIALIVDGIPLVYLLPCQLPMLLQSPEDYANHFLIGSALRIIRYLAMVITIFLPCFYIAAASYQNQMLPVQMALSAQAAKQNVPFSSSAEVLGMLLAFEILIEAGLRLPKAIGTAMSILGGIVVGQSAVSANIVSPLVVVIVSLAGIAGFVMPNQDLANGIRVIRFSFAFLAAAGGFFGLTVGLILLLTHLCSLDNYGLAYLSPFVDINESNHKDTLFRFPIKYFRKRTEKLAPENHIKQKQ
jgi:spore germination protein KA